MTPSLVVKYLVVNYGNIVQEPESGEIVWTKYVKFLVTSKSSSFAFRKRVRGNTWKSWKKTARGAREFPWNTAKSIRSWKTTWKEERKKRPSWPINQLTIETRRVKTRQQGKRWGWESHGVATLDKEAKWEGWATEKASKKQWHSRLCKGVSRKGIGPVKAWWVGGKEEERRSYQIYLAGIVHTAARSATVTDAAKKVKNKNGQWPLWASVDFSSARHPRQI